MPTSHAQRSFPWHWLPGAAVVLAGCAASYALYHQQQSSMQAIARVRFEQEARLFAETLQRRMESHADLLQGMRGLLTVNPQLRRADFERVARELDLRHYHPGVKNINFTRYVPGPRRAAFEEQARSDPHLDGDLPRDFAIHPQAVLPDYFVVDYLWPQGGNSSVQGLEIHSQPANLEAMRRARDTGGLVASAPFELHQETEHRTGVIIRMPVFAEPAAGQAGPARFLGAVGVSLRIYDIVHAVRTAGNMQGLALRMADVGPFNSEEPAPPQSLFESETRVGTSAMEYEQSVRVGGRRWSLQFQPVVPFLSPQESRLPWLLGSGGLLVTALLTALVSMLVLRRSQALDHAKETDTALRESEARLRAVFNQAAVGIAQTDSRTGRLVRMNQKFCDLLGYSAQELQQMRFQDFSEPSDLAADLEQLQRMLAGELSEYRMEKRYRRKDGSEVWVDLMVSPLRLEGQPEHHLAVVQDISKRKHMEQVLRQSEEHLRNILNHMPVGVNQVQDGKIVFRNDRHVQICGYDIREAPDVDTWWRLVMPDAHQREHAREAWHAACTAALKNPDGAIRTVECVITAKSGVRRAVELSGMILGDSHIVTMVDQSQRKAAEEEVRYLAYNDPLTGLPNRRLLLDRLEQALAMSARHQLCGAVMMLDLDNFKTINETQGPDMGDRLLREVARRLRDCVPEDETLARHGGDEFVVVLKDLGADPQEAANRAEEMGQTILAAIRAPFDIDGQQHHTALSVGIAIFRGVRESADELLKRSDLAMYEAKAAGRDTLRFFDPQMQAAVSERAALEADLRAGLDAGQLELFYQPKVDQGRITGAEALVRWRHPDRGFISPAEFIPLAEESGLILRVGEWVMRSACAQLAQWSAHPVLGELTVAVNVSPRQFHEGSFVPQVLEALAASGADARRLRLELTEGMLLQDVEDTIAKMVQLRGYGVGFSLDDFGTGYSSLAYLKRLPLHELKIDKSFVRDVLTDPNDAVIARTIVALGTSLGLRVVAEGVETEAQRAFLERNGCHAWQGYLLSPPLQAAAFEALVLKRAGV
ncbi:bifunctional diguanylate cyclase/phosphodiesterase [Diaphorobacter nitroreducens]|uniref:bifunctional diguanylate cyclase/phosphodiesterase n=1 Tax=Diaphorobacter nitroreducens TaxID=164759 RepID=UPI0028A13BAD|nr:EAL domain-containing protein [Diaphorobacter nitroreducens]